MTHFRISEASTTHLLALPESGMGFQLVVPGGGSIALYLVLNAEIAFSLAEISASLGQQRRDVIANGLALAEALSRSHEVPPMVDFSNGRLAASRYLEATGGFVALAAVPRIVAPSPLTKQVTLRSQRVFLRYSAFTNDRRVLQNGNFVPGTYAAPESERPLVPTGFAAVGRFALPNQSPASHIYEIQAAVKTRVGIGTVCPAFGQAGGGVEAYFPKGAVNLGGAGPPPQPIPDD